MAARASATTRRLIRYAGWIAFPLILLFLWQDDVLTDVLTSSGYRVVLLSLLLVLLLAAYFDFQALRESRQGEF